jgi:hypothetical protein
MTAAYRRTGSTSCTSYCSRSNRLGASTTFAPLPVLRYTSTLQTPARPSFQGVTPEKVGCTARTRVVNPPSRGLTPETTEGRARCPGWSAGSRFVSRERASCMGVEATYRPTGGGAALADALSLIERNRWLVQLVLPVLRYAVPARPPPLSPEGYPRLRRLPPVRTGGEPALGGGNPRRMLVLAGVTPRRDAGVGGVTPRRDAGVGGVTPRPDAGVGGGDPTPGRWCWRGAPSLARARGLRSPPRVSL